MKRKTKKVKKPRKQRPPKPYKELEFEAYITWKTLPVVLRGQSRGFLTKLGFDDELTLELLKIKTQTEFAAKYGLALETLTYWNQKPDLQDKMKKARSLWIKLTSNVIFSLYKNILTKGYSSEVKLWFQIIEGWIEKTKVDGGGTTINVDNRNKYDNWDVGRLQSEFRKRRLSLSVGSDKEK